MAVEVAAGYVSVVPSADGFGSALAKEIAPLEQHAKDVGEKASTGFASKMKSGLGDAFKVLPPELQELGERVGELGETVGQKFNSGLQKTLTVASGVGAAVAAIGVKTSLAAAKAAEGEAALRRVIENSGKSYETYADKIEKARDQQAKFGHNSEDVDKALTQLTIRLKDPQKALDALGLAANIAALKHISLAEASTLAAQAEAGNARVLKQFGINLKDATKAQDDAKKATEDQAKAKDLAAKATQKLADLERILADRHKQSLGDTIALRRAEEDVTRARDSGNADRLAAAEQRLSDTRARVLEKTQLTVPEQIALRDAHDAVTGAAMNLAAANTTVAQTQDVASQAIKGTDDAVAKLKTTVAGLADEQAQTLKGRIDAATATFQNLEVEVGQKVGPALAAVGTVFSTVTGIMANCAAIQETKLIPALQATELELGLTSAAGLGASAALTGGVIAGVALGLELHNLIEQHFPAADRALERFGGTIFDDLIAPIGRLTGKDGAFSHLGGSIYDDIITPLDKAWQAVDRFIHRLGDLNPLKGLAALGSAVLPGRAEGGTVEPGRAYVVGERRPELFVPNVAGTIAPSVAGHGASITQQITAIPNEPLAETMRRSNRELLWQLKTA